MSCTTYLPVLVAALVSGCVLTQEPAHDPPAFPGATAPPSEGVPVGPVASRAPRIVFEGASSDDLARARARLAPAEQALAGCVPNSSGVLRVRVTRRGDRVTYSIASSALDAVGRRCALEALSTVEVDDINSHGSPSDRPSGFTALIRIEW